MKRYIFFLILALSSLALFAASVTAQTLLRYPIPELGFCRDAKECYLYCEIASNKAACWSYGEFRLGAQVLGTTTLSQEEISQMRQMAAEKGITFPISELGNCAGPQECRDFCEEPANHTACTNFARRYGFSEGGGETGREAEILAEAQSELGCTTKEECFRICEQNHERCMAFAKRHGLYQEGSQDIDKSRMLDSARSELGCTSMEACARICEQNPERCMGFVKRHGFEEGTQEQQQSGPGSCSSEESCRRYCQEHPSECPGYQEHPDQGSFSSPSGCRTAQECEAYCRTNPNQCPGYTEAQQDSVPQSSAGISPQPSSYEPAQTESQPAYSPPPEYPQEYPSP